MKANLQAIVVFVVCGLAACTTQEAKPDGGSGTGGTGGAGGGGTGGGAGGGGGGSANNGVACLPPQQQITDFTFDADGGSMTEGRFGTVGTSLSGGQFTYPSTLMSNVTGNDWNIKGRITNYSGFNLYFDAGTNMCNKVDASAYAGISFTIWGTTGGNNMLTMGIGTVANAPTAAWLLSIGDTMVRATDPGRCTPTSGNRDYHPGCANAVYAFNLTGTQAAPQTISVMWNGFTGGMPEPNVTPSEITSIYWFVPWAVGATPYDVDIHIDNLAFIPR